MASKESVAHASEVEDQGKSSKKQKNASLEARVAKTELTMGDMMDSIKELEESIDRVDGNFNTLDQRQEQVESSLEGTRDEFQGLLNALADTLRRELKEAKDAIMGRVEAMGAAIESLKGDVALCKTALAAGAMVRDGPRIKVPEPPRFNGQRDAKEIDNFLWSIEKYFEALNLGSDTSKINVATMYLGEDAILWWRRREVDGKNGTFIINTWDEFKADFKRQFYPENAEEVAMKKLRGLRHTGSIKDYIRQYSSLMLETPDMPEKSRLLYFMDGLQKWAEQELKRRNVQDLTQAIAVVESLIEFQQDWNSRRDKGKKVIEDDQDEEGTHQHKTKVDQAKEKDRLSSRGREKR